MIVPTYSAGVRMVMRSCGSLICSISVGGGRLEGLCTCNISPAVVSTS